MLWLWLVSIQCPEVAVIDATPVKKLQHSSHAHTQC